jgi:hypothetical protein
MLRLTSQAHSGAFRKLDEQAIPLCQLLFPRRSGEDEQNRCAGAARWGPGGTE